MKINITNVPNKTWTWDQIKVGQIIKFKNDYNLYMLITVNGSAYSTLMCINTTNQNARVFSEKDMVIVSMWEIEKVYNLTGINLEEVN